MPWRLSPLTFTATCSRRCSRFAPTSFRDARTTQYQTRICLFLTTRSCDHRRSATRVHSAIRPSCSSCIVSSYLLLALSPSPGFAQKIFFRTFFRRFVSAPFLASSSCVPPVRPRSVVVAASRTHWLSRSTYFKKINVPLDSLWPHWYRRIRSIVSLARTRTISAPHFFAVWNQCPWNGRAREPLWKYQEELF